MATVFIPNRGAHDFTAARRWGSLIYMTEGSIDRYATSQMYRIFEGYLRNSTPDDYLLLTGLGVMNAVACGMYAHKHGRLNLLLHRDGGYVERKMML